MPPSASSNASSAKEASSVIVKRREATEASTISSNVCTSEMGTSRSRLLMTARSAGTSAAVEVVVFSTTCAGEKFVPRYGKYTASVGCLSRPRSRMSPTTPTIRACRSPCPFQTIRSRPIGSWPSNSCFTTRSLTTAVICSPATTSASVKVRPRSSGTPIARK